MTDRPQLNPLFKFVLDLGPLLLFFLANAKPALFEPWLAPIIPEAVATGERAGIFVATAVFMVAILAALVVSYVLTRRLPVMAVVSAVDRRGVRRRDAVLPERDLHQAQADHHLSAVRRHVCSAADLSQAAARDGVRSGVPPDRRGLAQADGALGAVLSGAGRLNEIVWRTQSTDTWVTFKVFGVMPLTFIFAALQFPLLTKYQAESKKE
jgi:intracellular septation protein